MDTVFLKFSDDPGKGGESIKEWIEKTDKHWSEMLSAVLDLCRIPDVFKEADLWHPLRRIRDQENIIARLQQLGSLVILSSPGTVDVQLEIEKEVGITVGVDFDMNEYPTSEMLARCIFQVAVTYTQLQKGVFSLKED